MRKMVIGIAALAVAAGICGCGKSTDEKAAEAYFADAPFQDYVELHSRMTDVPTGAVCRLEQMSPSDVVVTVNGYPMTRDSYDKELALRTKQILNRKDMNELLADELIAQARREIVPDFVRLRLLIDAAKRLEVMNSNDVFKVVNETVTASAKKQRKTVEDFLARFPCDKTLVFYDIAQRTWVNALIAKHIPPDVKVTEEVVAALQKEVASMNAAATATNEMHKSDMRRWKSEILAGKTTFAEMAKAHSQDYCEERDIPGFWGEFERGDMDDKNVEEEVFAMTEGEISEPIEDDNGIHMVQIAEIKPAQRDKDGRIENRETRVVKHIYIEKEPLLITQSDEEMKKDARRQMQLQAIDTFVQCQMTNGLNKVVYPHGENLYKE